MKKIISMVLALTLTLATCITAFAEPTQEELLAQYYAALAKQQAANSNSVATTTDTAKENPNVITKNLGSGIVFSSARHLEDYFVDMYEGSLDIIDVKMVEKARYLTGGKISIKYVVNDYADVYPKGQVAVRIYFLDEDGFEISNSILVANASEEKVGKTYTYSVYLPKGTKSITVEAN